MQYKYSLALMLMFASFLYTNGQSIKAGSVNACVLSKNVDLHLTTINNKAKEVIKSSADKCILILLDSLTSRAIQRSGSNYFASLESLYKNSDGYESEYYLELGTRLFYSKFKDYILFIYDRRSLKENHLEKVLVESISMEMSNVHNIDNYKKKLDLFIANEEKKYSFTSDQLKYIKKLRSLFDPKMFD